MDLPDSNQYSIYASLLIPIAKISERYAIPHNIIESYIKDYNIHISTVSLDSTKHIHNIYAVMESSSNLISTISRIVNFISKIMCKKIPQDKQENYSEFFNLLSLTEKNFQSYERSTIEDLNTYKYNTLLDTINIYCTKILFILNKDEEDVVTPHAIAPTEALMSAVAVPTATAPVEDVSTTSAPMKAVPTATAPVEVVSTTPIHTVPAPATPTWSREYSNQIIMKLANKIMIQYFKSPAICFFLQNFGHPLIIKQSSVEVRPVSLDVVELDPIDSEIQNSYLWNSRLYAVFDKQPVLNQASNVSTIEKEKIFNDLKSDTLLRLDHDGYYYISGTSIRVDVKVGVPNNVFENNLKRVFGGISNILVLAKKYFAYHVLGRVLKDDTTLYHNLVVESDSIKNIVTIELFERFVKICAEPSAQVAWLIYAQNALKHGLSLIFKQIEKNYEYVADTEYRARFIYTKVKDLITSGYLATYITISVLESIKPYTNAIIGSAFSAYAHGGIPGAWCGFLPCQEVNNMLMDQAPLELGSFIVRLSRSKLSDIVISSVSRVVSDAGVGAASNIIHECMTHSDDGNSLKINNINYPSPAQAVCQLRKYTQPCLKASMAVIGWAAPSNIDPDCTELGTMSFGLLAQKIFTDLELIESLINTDKIHFSIGLSFILDVMCGSSENSRKLKLFNLLQNERFEINIKQKDLIICISNFINENPLPGINNPISLLETVHMGPLPVPSPYILPEAVPYSSGSKNTLKRYAFNGFHGALVYEQTLARLAHSQPGSYLLRPSQSQRSSVVLAFVDASNKVQQSIISPDVSKPENIGKGIVTCSGSTFPSLLSVLLAYSIPLEGRTNALLKTAVPPASKKITMEINKGVSNIIADSVELLVNSALLDNIIRTISAPSHPEPVASASSHPESVECGALSYQAHCAVDSEEPVSVIFGSPSAPPPSPIPT